MYRVTIYNGTTETVIHEPSTDVNDAHLYECSLVQGSSGEIDSLSFTITPNNPGYESLNPYTTFIDVADLRARGEAAVFSGRVLSVSPQMEDSGMVYKNVVCEDRLGYLCDSIQPYTSMATYTVKEFLTLLLNNHNAQVEDYKKIYVGEVSFETSSGNVTKSLNYQTTWEAITGKLLELGGEIQLYSYNGLLYLDYVTELGSMGSQTIEIAKNMRSLQQDKSPTDIITRLIPLGDYLDEQTGESDDRERLNISSVNGGKIYIDDSDAIDAYGIIEGTVIWEDVTIASNLLEKGQQWLKDQSINETISLDAYDLYAAGIDPNVIERYNYYLTVNPLIGVNKYYRVAQKKINIIDPTDVTFTMGDQSTSLSSAVKRTGQDAADAAAAINANLSKTVASLIAGNAIIVSLQASTADIYSLLSGNIGTGELQTIHLTAENVVIDEGVIINALMENATIGNLIAGKIYTDFIEIMDNEEDQSLYITGSVIQFKDADGVVRMQIGLDASGYWNYYILDDSGNVIFDALGLTEEGLIGNGAIIRDVAVADDANIAGYKIDMETLTECINEYGGLVMDATQVIIDGNTLDYELTRITQEIDGLSFEGLKDWKLYFAKNTSDTIPPEDDYYYGAICNIAICGMAICGLVEGSGIWSLEEPTADITSDGYIEYIWAKYWIERVDGTVEWSEPFLWSDSSLRRYTSTLQTELSVVQGVIDARVWETYTDTAINNYDSIVGDRFAEIRVELNSITSTVGEIETKYDGEIASMTTDISEIKQTSGEISLTVESLEQEVEKNASDIAGAIAKIDMLPDSITLSVTDASLGNSAYISLEVDGKVTSDVLLDLREVRQAFADDKTAIVISAGTVAFESNTFLVESKYFRVTADGHIYATAGTIGGWEIGSTSLYNGTSSMSSTTNGTFLGATSGIRQYQDGDYINITGAVLTNGNADGDKAELTEGKLQFTHNGTYLGYYGTSSPEAEPDKCGFAIDAEYATSYIAFGHRNSPNEWIYEWDYIINWGLDEAVSYTQRHIFYNSMMITGGLTVDSRVYAQGFRVGTSDSYITSLAGGLLRYYDDNGDRIGDMLSTTVIGDFLETIISPDRTGISWGVYASSSSSETSWSPKLTYRTSNSGNMEGLHASCDTDLHNWHIYPYYNSYPSLYISHGYTSSGHYTALCGGAAFVSDSNSVVLTYYGSGSINVFTTLDMHNWDIVNQSDIRLKENITDTAVDALNVINSIDLKAFDWIETGEHKDIGIIANQLREVAPELVTETDGVLGIVQSDLIYYALKAIQELSEKMGLEYDKAQYAETYSKKDKQKLVDKMIQAHTAIEDEPEPAPIMEE